MITSDSQYKPREKYDTDVVIEPSSTKLNEKSWILCAQPYPVLKSLLESDSVWCAGKLSSDKMDDVDEALYLGLCMGLQQELELDIQDESA